jgi:hypothetical protein
LYGHSRSRIEESQMSRDTIIRDTAYAIWEAEGRPEGRSLQHWFMAEQQVARNTKGEAAVKDGTTRSKAHAGSAARKAPVRKPAPKAPAVSKH